MKQLLIILTFFLLSNPVFAQIPYKDIPKGFIWKGGGRSTLFLWNTFEEGQIWRDFGDEELQPIYRGEQTVKKNLKNIFPFPDGLGILYNGFFEVGGRIIFKKNYFVIGEWHSGLLHGQVTIKGRDYFEEGTFDKGQRSYTNVFKKKSLQKRYEDGVLVCFGKDFWHKESELPRCPKE